MGSEDFFFYLRSWLEYRIILSSRKLIQPHKTMNTSMNTSKLTTLAAALASAQIASAAVIINHDFGGTGNLDTETADFFDSAITTAGGSDSWVAATTFDADGTVSGEWDSAYLTVGSFINDTKGTASGKFTATATLDVGSLSDWIGFGFFETNAPNELGAFTTDDQGSGTLIYRDDGTLDGFGGLGTNNSVDGGTSTFSGSQLLTIVLDLTPAGGYDGTGNFGDITFYQGDVDTGTVLGSEEYTTDRTFGAFGLTATNGGSGSASGLTLEQVPEPSAAVRVQDKKVNWLG